MADQVFAFDDALKIFGSRVETKLTGSIAVTYGNSPSVQGTLSIAAFEGLGVQTFDHLTVTQTGYNGHGIPTYVIGGSNGITAVSIDYTGMSPPHIAAGVSTSAGVGLAANDLAAIQAVVCFAQGTMIRTVHGEVAVEALEIGDLVITASGKRRPIRWLGRRTIDCRRHPEPGAVLPIRIAADAFATHVPSTDLMVSPGHGIVVSVVDEVLMPAALLCNGSTVRQLEVDAVTYWHVELESHDILFANGMKSESYIDVGNRSFFAANAEEQPDGTPDAAAFEKYCRPYVLEECFVRAVRRRLQARAASLGWALGEAPLAGLHLLVDGTVVEPLIDGLVAHFALPAGGGAGEVWLQAEASVPAFVTDSPDMRRLGVCLRALVVGGQRVAAEDPLLCIGFHPAEGEGSDMYRWTTGRALVPAALLPVGAAELVVELAGPALPRWTAPAETEQAPALRSAA